MHQEINLPAPTFAEATRFWIKLGFINFGGPTGQIAIMHRELVDRKQWISDERFLHALNFCMLLPGPEAIQLAIYIGWLLHRTRGGIVAGFFFLLPSVFFLWFLSFVYVSYGTIPWIAAIFHGLKAAVLAIVVSAVIRIGKRALKNAWLWLLAAAAFVAIFYFHIRFPWIILCAALIGLLLRNNKTEVQQTVEGHTRPSFARALKVLFIGLVLWWTPVAIAGAWMGPQSTLFRQGLFFSWAAVITFGGAYAVLPYVSQQAVETFHWLTAPQMVDGLGLAETTPGPLIMVLQFVGFLGGWNHPDAASPLASATLCALMTTWVTFVPSFLFIFLGAPHVEQLRGNRSLSSALTGITAAVVGVILNLAVWFAIHTVVPSFDHIDWFALGVGIVSFVLLQWRKWDIVAVVLLSAAAGLTYYFVK